MIDEIELAMILYTQGHKIKHDVAHFIKVHQYARLIGKAEHLEEREQFILEVAAICHDIACPMCREKYFSEIILRDVENIFPQREKSAQGSPWNPGGTPNKKALTENSVRAWLPWSW